MNKKFHKSLRTALWIAICSFVLFVFGSMILLANTITIQNVLAFAITSILFGVFGGFLDYFPYKLGFYLYVLGVLIGFIEMYRAFLQDLSGWSDLVGLMTLFVFAGIGLVAGVLVLLLQYLFASKYQTRKK